MPQIDNITPPSSPTGNEYSLTNRISVSILGPSTEGSLESSMIQLAWPDRNESVVAGPYDYLHRNAGKGVRTQVIKAINVWMDVPLDRLEIICESVQMLHTASLLIDDIEDGSALRRGIPVAHRVYGVAQTINSANYFYFRAVEKIQKLRSTNAMGHAVDELLQLHRGQGMDLHWRDSLICPTEDEYLEMICNKTGGLFRLAIKLMQTQSRKTAMSDCVRLADLLGLLFQIRDDYQNLCSKEYTKSKGFCEDLTEGKFSFPIIHSIHHDPTNLVLLNILKEKPTDLDVKQYAVRCMEKTGSFEYTRMFISKLIVEARGLVDGISAGQGNGGHLHAVLDKLAV